MPESNVARFDGPRFQAWLGVKQDAKPKVYQQIAAGAAINSLSYWLEIFFAAGIAAFGLVESSPAVIIGAMLISPLMGPIMGTGLALAVGDLYLGIKAVLNLVASVAASIAFSGFLVWLLPFHSATTEIVSRTNPNLLDLGIALLSGLAGSIMVSRGSNDGVTALPGVAIAVALMPPLCVMGFGLGSGPNMEIMSGAGLLFLTNLVAIVASAFLVFILVGMNTGEVRKEILATRQSEPLARLLRLVPKEQTLTTGGRLHWRILMILILLGGLAVPLRKALLQVAKETVARGAVQKDLKRLAPSDAIVSQQVTVGKDTIVIRLISTRAIPESKITDVREDLKRRTGYSVKLSVEAVVGKNDLAELMARLSRPAPTVESEKTALELREELFEKVRPLIQKVWPADASIQDFTVVIGAGGATIDVHYEAPKDLDGVAIKTVLQSLQTELGMPDLTLKAENIGSGTATDHAPNSGDKQKRP